MTVGDVLLLVPPAGQRSRKGGNQRSRPDSTFQFINPWSVKAAIIYCRAEIQNNYQLYYIWYTWYTRYTNSGISTAHQNKSTVVQHYVLFREHRHIIRNYMSNVPHCIRNSTIINTVVEAIQPMTWVNAGLDKHGSSGRTAVAQHQTGL